MAGTSDKVQFFQEQSVPELQEFARKEIFTKQEITSIARKRSDFEHILNARGSKSQDYTRFAEYEMNLESLRRKRVKRLGVKTSHHNGQRRIFFILDRATRKFPNDLGLWMQYVTFAQRQKSDKKVLQIFTNMLRLHPTKPELWIHAANMRDDHMAEARSYMQRGLRFCGNSKALWIEYARLEMIHISKIAARRRILGLDVEEVEDKARLNPETENEDMILLPALTADDALPARRPSNSIEEEVLVKLNTSPALSGAIPMAIFDAAMKHFKESNELCRLFFDTIAEIHGTLCRERILSHIMDTLLSIAPESPETLIRWIQQPVIGIDVSSPEFPTAFVHCLDRMKKAFETLTSTTIAAETTGPQSILREQLIVWMLSYKERDIDPDLRKVLEIATRKVEALSRTSQRVA